MRGLRDLRRSLTRGERERAAHELARSPSSAASPPGSSRDLLHRSAHGAFSLARSSSAVSSPPLAPAPAPATPSAMSPSTSHGSHAPVNARAPPQLIIQATTSSPPAPLPPGSHPYSAGDFFHVQVEPPPGADWFDAVDPIHGTAGRVPQSAFTVLTRSVRQSATPSFPISPGGATTATSRSSTSMSITSPPAAPAPAPHIPAGLHPAMRGMLAHVRYEFTAERPDELAVPEGSEVVVLAHSTKEWYVARALPPPAATAERDRPGQPTSAQLASAGRIGLLPAAYVSLRDPASGRILADHEAEALVFAGVIPPVEEWKRRVSAFSQASQQAQAQQAQAKAQRAQQAQQARAPPPAQSHATPHAQPFDVDDRANLPPHPVPAGHTDALIEGADPAELLRAGHLPPGGIPLPTGMVTSARVDGVHFEQGDYWFRVRATHLSWPAPPAPGPSRGLRLAHGGRVPARPQNEEEEEVDDEEEEDDLEGIDDLTPPRDHDPDLPEPPDDLPKAPAGQVRDLILYRLYEDFHEFHIALMDYFPQEAALGQAEAHRLAAMEETGVRASMGSNVSASGYNASLPQVDSEGRAFLPLMPGPVPPSVQRDDPSGQGVIDAAWEQQASDLSLYTVQLTALPLYIARSELVRLFFEPRPGDGCDLVHHLGDPLAQNGAATPGYAFPVSNSSSGGGDAEQLAGQLANNHLEPFAMTRSSGSGGAGTDPAGHGGGMGMTRNWSTSSGASTSWLPMPTTSGAGGNEVPIVGNRGSHNTSTSKTSASTKSWGSAASVSVPYKAPSMGRGPTGTSANTSLTTAGSHAVPAPAATPASNAATTAAAAAAAAAAVGTAEALKVKVLHLGTGDVVALRVPRATTLGQLVLRVRDRFALSDGRPLELRYNPHNPCAPAVAPNPAELRPLDSDDALVRWADGRTKLTLFACDQ